MSSPIDAWDIVPAKAPPHDKHQWVRIAAQIRNNKTNEVRLYHTDGIWDSDNNTSHTYIWREGNFCCDCNRANFFGQAGGELCNLDLPCGEKGFSVNLINPKDGSVFYREFTPWRSTIFSICERQQ